MRKRALLVLILALSFAGCTRSACCPAPPDAAPVREPVQVSVYDQVFVEIHCARIRLEGRERQIGLAAAPGETVVMHLGEAGEILKRWREDPGIEIVQAPRMLELNGREATLFISESADGAKPGDPGFLGSYFRMTPTLADDGKHIRIAYHSAIKLTDPAVFEEGMSKEAWAAAVAAMPYARTDADFTLRSGTYVLLGNGQRMKHSEGDYQLVTLLTAKRIPDDPRAAMRTQMPPREDSLHPPR